MDRPPTRRNPVEGRNFAVVGDVYRFLATSEETNGKYALWEAIVPPSRAGHLVITGDRGVRKKESAMTITAINAQALAKLCNEGMKVDLIDVRTPVEYQEVHVENARNVPLDQLDPAAVMNSRNGSADEPLYVICRFGSRGEQACEKFLKAGFPSVVNIEGGTVACVEAGVPVVRGKKAVSLERQVRIAAGSLVLVGAVLGWFVHPALVGLSAFVGAGLVFSGITDTCGMGMVLARMPWNRRC